jgi:hypothetical protein
MPRVEYDPRITLGAIITSVVAFLTAVGIIGGVFLSYGRLDDRGLQNREIAVRAERKVDDLSNRVHTLERDMAVINSQLGEIRTGVNEIRGDMRRFLGPDPRQQQQRIHQD